MAAVNPLVSVIMPVHNGEKYIRAALASVVADDCDAIEVLVVDDGSCDRSIEIARGFDHQGGFQRVFEHVGQLEGFLLVELAADPAASR